MPRKSVRRLLVFLCLVLGVALAIAVEATGGVGVPVIDTLLWTLAVAGALLTLLWVLWRVLRAFLWRVSRRLAFSYFLIGVLPIPMVVLLLGLTGYLLAGFFLGHLYRDAVNGLHHDLLQAAERRQEVRSEPADAAALADRGFAFGYYRDGRRVGGDARLPDLWPAWIGVGEAVGFDPARVKETVRPYVALPDGRPALAAAAGGAARGVVALFVGDLEPTLSERSDVWVELLRSDDPEATSHVKLVIGSKEFALKPLRGKERADEAAAFFDRRSLGGSWVDRPLFLWGEISGPFRSLADGEVVSEYVLASLRATPRLAHRHLFSSNAEINAATWAAMIGIAFLLFDVYIAGVLVALFLIFGLSRAVNRLSRATAAVLAGDFTVRIPARRRDQVGQLQRSFNEMIANLESLVAAEAQKEALEKELAVARDLQKSLIPTDLPSTESLEFAALFEPSAAIGGDYFDLLKAHDDQLVFVIADVSGHGLPSGLRMAMVKAALLMLVEDVRRPADILTKLDEMIRQSGRRYFVTATIALIDLARGRLHLTNAGHPPTYLLRSAKVEEILLPGAPLGALDNIYGEREFALAPGDIVVWLSDGLIEAADAAGEPFGYDRVRAALAGPVASAAAVRDRLLAAVAAHTGGRAGEDDKTLVAMRYRAPAVPPPA